MQSRPAGDIDVERLRTLLEHLTTHPEQHDQGTWAYRVERDNHCETVCCAAGWTIALDETYALRWYEDTMRPGVSVAGFAETDRGWSRPIREVARDLLGFTDKQATVFFDTSNSLYRLWGYASLWTDRAIVMPDTVTPSGLRP